MKEQNETQAIEEIEELTTVLYEANHKKKCVRLSLAYNGGIQRRLPQAERGKWILTGTFKSTFPLPVADLHISCSVCGWKPPKYSDDYKEYNFCPNCGARMKGGEQT